MSSQQFKFEDLPYCELIVDAIYESDGSTISGEPITKLLGVGNQGGFRLLGKGSQKKLVVLYTTGEDSDWPDILDIATGKFLYFGDNKVPGSDLHDKLGNVLLRDTFDSLHAQNRSSIPPFFVFRKFALDGKPRSVQFKGLAVPGFNGMTSNEDLIAIWRNSNGQRFQNYRAVFTILNVGKISREWIKDISQLSISSYNMPDEYRAWVSNGIYNALEAPPTISIRTPEQQKPDTELKKKILRVVWEYFEHSPFLFESFAAEIYRLHDPRAVIDEITRRSVDGGRDAVGRIMHGISEDYIPIYFALEAKCYQPGLDNSNKINTVGVKEVSRLISRIRNRDVGVLVTTSIVAKQAYEEVRQDGHPIIFIAGGDIAEILIKNGYSTSERALTYLESNFPKS
jgi:hypothetical protein